MKIAMLSAVATFLCLGVGNAQPLEFPSYRYVFWDDLTDTNRTTAQILNYTQATWDQPGSNAIEYKAWSNLTTVQKSNATAMGYDWEIWNCYQNHYEDYDWIDLQEEFLVEYFEVFGWNEDNWNGTGDEPLAADEYWANLTFVQQDAAQELCYFTSDLWDEEPFQLWVPFPPETPPLWVPSTALEFPFFRYVLWNDLTDELRQSAIGLEYTIETWQQPNTNDLEFEQWFYLTEVQKSNAVTMGYNEDTWDCFQNNYDDWDWSDLLDIGLAQHQEAFGWVEDTWQNRSAANPLAWDADWADLTPAQQDAARGLCIFRSELWDEINFSLWVQSPPVITLTETPTEPPTGTPTATPTASPSGTPTATPSGTPTATPVPTESTISPAPTKMPVITKSPTEMPSDGPSVVPSNDPTESVMPSFNPTMAPSISPTQAPNTPSPTDGPFRGPAEDIEYPRYRYIAWELLDDATKQAGEDFSYQKGTWNTPGTNEIEISGWYIFDSEQIGLLVDIGFSEDVWDCHVNHHEDYEWNELEYIDVARHWEALGWNETSWDGDIDDPESADNSWNDLNAEEQEAAGELCYFEELWDEKSLLGDNVWGDLPTPSPSFSPTGEQPSAASSMPMSLIVASAFGALLLII
jgi:hypothetical protein